jgi:hypothetical protein
MSKNFEKFNNVNGNGSNGNYDRKIKEYNILRRKEIDYDLFLDINMRIFALLMQSNRNFAEAVRHDYEEFINEMDNYFHRNKELKGFLEYMGKTKPDNYWIDAADGVIDSLRSLHGDKFDNYLKKFIGKFVKRKINRKGIQ